MRKRSQSQDGKESTAIEKLPNEKHIGTSNIELDSRSKNQDCHKEDHEVHHCVQTRDIAKTTDQPMSCQYQEVP